jgi:hypothetical protein
MGVSSVIRSMERRGSYRLELRSGQAMVRAAGAAALELEEVGVGGGRLLLHGTAGLALSSVEIALAGEDVFCAPLTVVHVHRRAPELFQLGARFGALAPGDLHRLSRFVSREYERRTSGPARLLDDRRILTITSSLFMRTILRQPGHGPSPLLWVADGTRRLPLRLRTGETGFADGVRVIRTQVMGDPAALVEGRSYRLFLNAPGAVTIFESVLARLRGPEAWLTLPDQMRQAGVRPLPRVAVSRARAGAVTFVHPHLPGAPVRAALHDIAGRGLSFHVDAAEHGLFPGDKLDGVRLALPGATVEAKGMVRSLAAHDATPGLCCGIELVDFRGPADAERWRRFVFASMHPNLVDGQRRAAIGWRLLEASHYVDLWTPTGARSHVHARYLDQWQSPAGGVGHSVVLRRHRAAAGMVSGTLVYPHSWLVHHLARHAGDDREDAQTPLRQVGELITGIFHRLLLETDMHFFFIYIERDKRLNERLYVDFARHYYDPTKHLLTELEVFRRSTAAACGPAAPMGIEVRGATRPLLAELAATLSTTAPAVEREAFALDEARIDLAAFTRDCARLRHERRRDVFFASDGVGPGAALIAETGDEGVNIFGLLNSCRIVSLGAAPPGPALRSALLARAVDHYRQRGKKHFLLLEDTAPDDVPVQLGFERVSGALRWITHRDAVPAFTAYLDGLLSSGLQDGQAARTRRDATGPLAGAPRARPGIGAAGTR